MLMQYDCTVKTKCVLRHVLWLCIYSTHFMQSIPLFFRGDCSMSYRKTLRESKKLIPFSLPLVFIYLFFISVCFRQVIYSLYIKMLGLILQCNKANKSMFIKALQGLRCVYLPKCMGQDKEHCERRFERQKGISLTIMDFSIV